LLGGHVNPAFRNIARRLLSIVMAGLVPAIYVFEFIENSVMPALRPGMTDSI
jgi:hypothetical protein